MYTAFDKIVESHCFNPQDSRRRSSPEIRDWFSLFTVQTVQHPVCSARYVLPDAHSDQTVKVAVMT